jgi:hypothetical protein
MTVIATIITKHCTAHSTDSFLTERDSAGRITPVESQASKLVRVNAYSGAISYWGLARQAADWDTHQWISDQAGRAASHGSPERFSSHLASALTIALRGRRFRSEKERGLGLHFTAYEHIGGYWIPELFQIRNWTDESYSHVRTSGFEVRRESFGSVTMTSDRCAADGSVERRMAVHAMLQAGGMLRFVNGDPSLFAPLGTAVLGVFAELYSRGDIADGDSDDTHLSLVRRPIEVLSRLLADLTPKDKRLIGGKTHDLAIRPGPRYHSTSGD